jgi:hypothetical protein
VLGIPRPCLSPYDLDGGDVVLAFRFDGPAPAPGDEAMPAELRAMMERFGASGEADPGLLGGASIEGMLGELFKSMRVSPSITRMMGGASAVPTLWGGSSSREEESVGRTYRLATSFEYGGPSPATGLVVDLGGVEYISSVGLRVLMLAAKEMRARKARVAAAAMQPIVAEIFAISRFDSVYEVFPALRDALAALSPQAAAAFDASAANG